MRDSDSLYHRLFAHPPMVESLVSEFVPRRLVANLDFSGLQRVNPKLHPARRLARRREADVIWRLPVREGTDRYLYLLIEFQSEIDSWMAVRTQVYQGLLWQQVIDEKKLEAGTPLPPLLSLVLYNGQRRWNSPTTVHELIDLSPEAALGPWQPRARYHLLDMGAFPKNELAHNPSLAALLFRLERQHSPEEIRALLDEVIEWFQRHEGHVRLQRLFAELIREALARHRLSLRAPGNLLEMQSMLTIDFEGSKRKWIAVGKAEGKAEGKVEGRMEALIWVLEKRFGAVAPYRQKRIRGAKLATLERWFKRAIVAPDLTSVFKPSGHARR